MATRRRQNQRIEPVFGSRKQPTKAKSPAKAPAGTKRPKRVVAAKPGTKSGESRTAGNGSGPTIIRRKVAQPKRAGSGKRAPSGSRRTPTARRARRRGFFPTFGRVVRGIVYWSVVVTIIGAAGTAGLIGYYWSKLPPTAEWTLPERPANVRILAANGTLISNRADTVGQTLSLDDMPPYLPEAVIAIEDRRYHWHFGVDPIGLARAMVANVRAGRIVQGGSTLTQQLAKNLFLTPERSFERKVQEVILAVWLEASLSKDEILELYLNRVYLGAGAYGVDAASHRYFGKSARNINLAEAAALAALLKAPSHYSPTANPEATEARTQLVLAAMHEQGYIDDREASLALSQDVRPVRDVAGGSGRYVADWVTAELPRYVGALTRDVIVDTTIDLRLQTLAAGAVTTTLGDLGAERGVSQGAFIAMDPYGGVRALVGGKDYASSPFNRAVDARRQPGSSFKPFVYLTALEHGLIPESVRIDQPVSIKGWRPENYTRQHLGPVTLQSALALSLNTVSAQLAAEVGPAEIAATARRLGVASPLMATPSIALGTSEVGLLEMTGAFASFANGGNGVIPHVIRRIRTVDGEVLYERSGNGPGPVIHPVHVGMMNGMLRDALERGTGKRAIVPGWPAAGKTGTSQDFRDAWFIGYTATLVAGVWFGNDDSTPTKKAAGGNLPAVAWQRFMSTALEGMVVADLPGNYRFRDPANFVDEPTPVATIGDDGEFLFPAPPDASGSVAAGPVHEEPRRGFFRRLFGG